MPAHVFRIKMKLQTRYLHIDFLKSTAILLMILGHCIQYGTGEGPDYWGDSLFSFFPFRLIYSFHMPLFAAISGYLTWFSVQNTTPLCFARKRLLGLGLPLVAWGAVNFIIALPSTNWTALQGPGIVFGLRIFRLLVQHCLGFLWFIQSILILSLWTGFVRGVLGDSVWIYAAAFLAGPLLPNTLHCAGLSVHIYYTVFLYPFFVGGYLWNRFGLNRCMTRPNRVPVAFCLSVLLFSLCFHFFRTECFVYATRTSALFHGKLSITQLKFNSIRTLTGLFGTLSLAFLFVWLTKFRPVRILEKPATAISSKSTSIP